MTGSIRAYGRHRKELGLSGGTQTSVQNAIREKRISIENGLIDFEKADADWARNTKSNPAMVTREARYGSGAKEPDGDGSEEFLSIIEAQRQKEVVKLQTDRLKLHEMEGKLLPLEEVRMHASGLVVNAKTRIRAIGSNLAPLLVGQSDANIIQSMIDKEADEALAQLAAWNP